MNGITLLALLVLVVGLPLAFRAGIERGRRDPRNRTELFRQTVAPAAMATDPRQREAPAGVAAPAAAPAPAPALATATIAPIVPHAVEPAIAATQSADALTAERARIIRASAAESFTLRARAAAGNAADTQRAAFTADRYRLQREFAGARADVARYRQLIVELEDGTPPPLLDGPHAPDDLKLIVGVGPMIERMLQKIGIGTYRQIARWSEHDVADFDARLPEFHGRIRRDGWVTQARELHFRKYGERP